MITPDHLIANKDRIDETADQLTAEDIGHHQRTDRIAENPAQWRYYFVLYQGYDRRPIG